MMQVTTFIEAEDKNFSLFNYVNELNNEVEKLEEQIANTRKEIEKHRGQVGCSVVVIVWLHGYFLSDFVCANNQLGIYIVRKNK
jgi:hypothetical protein